jgi:hypothetical protein
LIRAAARIALPLLLAALPWSAVRAEALRYCDRPAALDAVQKDRLLRFGGVVKAVLEESGQGLALVSRSGLDLGRFGVRYSHAGVSLKASANGAWSVRQLYYACDERKPRLFDQGIAGFVLGLDDPAVGYVSVVFLPPDDGAALERVALDDARALRLLGTTYSANAFPFNTAYQNCNQWLVELLAAAWGARDAGDGLRAGAQAWLRETGYAPTVFDLQPPPLIWLAAFVPWLHHDDHPPQDLAAGRFRVSMPASIEAFVRSRVPGARRMEFCIRDDTVVVRHGWEAIGEGCVAGAQDQVLRLD